MFCLFAGSLAVGDADIGVPSPFILRRYKVLHLVKTAARPEAIVYIALCALICAYLLLISLGNGGAVNTGLTLHYVKLNGRSVIQLVGVVFAFWVCTTLVRAWFLIVSASLRNIHPSTYFSRQTILNLRPGLLKSSKEIIIVVIPLLLVIYSLNLAVEQLNIFNAPRLRDELVMQVDFSSQAHIPL